MPIRSSKTNLWEILLKICIFTFTMDLICFIWIKFIRVIKMSSNIINGSANECLRYTWCRWIYTTSSYGSWIMINFYWLILNDFLMIFFILFYNLLFIKKYLNWLIYYSKISFTIFKLIIKRKWYFQDIIWSIFIML
jgi:hypothetical protein